MLKFTELMHGGCTAAAEWLQSTFGQMVVSLLEFAYAYIQFQLTSLNAQITDVATFSNLCIQ